MKILEYASMKNGLLTHKPIKPLQDAMQSKPYDGTLGPNGIRIYPREKQNILGFGGAFTQSSAYLYHQMSEKEKRKALELLFGESGLKYNFCRICIGSCDFSLGEYSYIKDESMQKTVRSLVKSGKSGSSLWYRPDLLVNPMRLAYVVIHHLRYFKKYRKYP